MSYITPKTTRGVQEQDVWTAADAVLQQGQRPTIERVRQHMGRGSPNTVGPMLESWFARLGERLVAAQSGAGVGERLPQSVQEAIHTLWQTALTQAQAIAQEALQTQQAQLTDAQAVLQARELQLQQRSDNLQQQKQALDEALKLAQAQQADLSERLDAMQQQLEQREQLLQAQRKEFDALQQQRDGERQAALAAAAQERQRLAEQFSGNEKRWLGELDRSRQEVEKLKKQQQQAAQEAQELLAQARSRQAELENECLVAQGALTTTQHSLELANERIGELKEVLHQQRPAPEAPAPRGSPSLQRRALAQKSLTRRR